MLLNNKIKILSIKLGTKNLTVAVLSDSDLIYWGNKFIRNGKLPEKIILKKAQNIVSQLIVFYQPKLIVVEKFSHPQTQKHRLLKAIGRETKKTARRYKLKVGIFSSHEAREFICRTEKPTKLNAAKIISGCYPWLSKIYEKEKNKPWFKAKPKLRIFDAIALGLYCLYKKTNHKKQT